jgi:hypothetical protein
VHAEIDGSDVESVDVFVVSATQLGNPDKYVGSVRLSAGPSGLGVRQDVVSEGGVCSCPKWGSVLVGPFGADWNHVDLDIDGAAKTVVVKIGTATGQYPLVDYYTSTELRLELGATQFYAASAEVNIDDLACDLL